MKDEPSVASGASTSEVLGRSPMPLREPRGLGEDAECWMYGLHSHQHLLLHVGLR